jgi:hypothetical protein
MEEIRVRMNEIERLVVLLLIQKEKLEEREEADPSKGSIYRTLLAIKQLNKKLETILGNNKLRTPKKPGIDVCKNERLVSDQIVELGLSVLQTRTSLETRPTNFNSVVETKEK